MNQIVRVSVLRCDADAFDAIRAAMIEAERDLRPGTEAMPGLIAYYAGVDAATLSLTNTSVWDTLDHARQLDRSSPCWTAASGSPPWVHGSNGRS